MSLLEALIAVPVFFLLALSGFFALEVLGALLPLRRATTAPAGRLAVVVPAHNEGAHLLPTLSDIKAQLRESDRLIVVADNCDDDTAAIAMRAGAACLIRKDPERLGKGYALQFALDKLREDSPAVVMFIDADCRLAEGAIARIAGAAAAAGRPAQGLYLIKAGEDAPARRRVAEFAWLVMNRVRMRGLFTLFDVCRTTGSGLALPWKIAASLDLASEEIVEDLALTVHLLAEDAAPVFVEDALISSEFPHSDEGAVAQHARWEHGSLRIALRRAPGMFVNAVGEADISRAAMALDIAIPPLTLFATILSGAFVAGLFLAALHMELPFDLASSALGVFAVAILIAWLVFGRSALPPSALGAIAGYALDKVKVYGRNARETTKRWTRADRSGPESGHDG